MHRQGVLRPLPRACDSCARGLIQELADGREQHLGHHPHHVPSPGIYCLILNIIGFIEILITVGASRELRRLAECLTYVIEEVHTNL